MEVSSAFSLPFSTYENNFPHIYDHMVPHYSHLRNHCVNYMEYYLPPQWSPPSVTLLISSIISNGFIANVRQNSIFPTCYVLHIIVPEQLVGSDALSTVHYPRKARFVLVLVGAVFDIVNAAPVVDPVCGFGEGMYYLSANTSTIYPAYFSSRR